MQPNELTLVCLIRVDTKRLPRDVNVSRLPDVITEAVEARLGTGASADDYFLVDRYHAAASAVDRVALPYHDYTTRVLHERCEAPFCETHVSGGAEVISINRRRACL